MQYSGVHPPRFNLQQDRLSDWPDCTLEIRCAAGCLHTGHPSVKLLMMKYGNPYFRDVLPRLRCHNCRKAPAPVYLVAGHHRRFCFGGPPDWSLELIPEP